jgi:hypothetical protein
VADTAKLSEEEKKQLATDNIFAFKDPRLRHMNKNFKREELQIGSVDFNDSQGVRSAIDEIIKFNLMTLEFNYMHDLFHQLNSLAVKRTGTYDWGSLFTFYDKNLDNLLDKNELRQMILDSGDPFSEATEAEVAFAFNVMAFFQKWLKKETFLQWVQTMLGRTKKKLISYS